MPIASIVFLDGDEGRRAVDALTHTDGVTVHGVTAASIEAVVDHLSRWDYGEYHDIGSVTRAGAMDDRVQFDHYLLSWNTGLGYVGLEVMLDETGQVENNATCRGCHQPVDYCLDHTHAPDEDSPEYLADHQAVTAALYTEE